jgi:NADH:ubiquinone oxidoreductase subunit F (NADH-binding)
MDHGDSRRAILLEDGSAAGPPAYEAWAFAERSLAPREIVEVVSASGLRGRGGAGLPTGKKLELTLAAAGPAKYVLANAAEDEPGSRKDRFLLERVPAKVVEGALIAALAIGARDLVFYVSVELDEARVSLERELRAAAAHGLTFVKGDIQRDAYEARLRAWLVDAPPAYVAGEDTAALEVIEGRKGLPREKPPYPVTEGLWGNPTFAANVETLAAIPSIVSRGPDWYRSLGTPESPGTMLFTLGDEMRNPGVYELEIGVRLSELLQHYGGGLSSEAPVKAVLPGGPSSGFLTADQLEITLDHTALREAGSALGCGIVRVYDSSSCLVEVLYEIMSFFARECCGQCPSCRMETSMLVRFSSRCGTEQRPARSSSSCQRS